MHSQSQTPCPQGRRSWSNGTSDSHTVRGLSKSDTQEASPRAQGQGGISIARATHHCIREPAQYQLSSALMRATYTRVNVKYVASGIELMSSFLG